RHRTDRGDEVGGGVDQISDRARRDRNPGPRRLEDRVEAREASLGGRVGRRGDASRRDRAEERDQELEARWHEDEDRLTLDAELVSTESASSASGFSTVLRSPTGSPMYFFRMAPRTIFAERVFGSAAIARISRGRNHCPSAFVMAFLSSARSVSLNVHSVRST